LGKDGLRIPFGSIRTYPALLVGGGLPSQVSKRTVHANRRGQATRPERPTCKSCSTTKIPNGVGFRAAHAPDPAWPFKCVSTTPSTSPFDAPRLVHAFWTIAHVIGVLLVLRRRLGRPNPRSRRLGKDQMAKSVCTGSMDSGFQEVYGTKPTKCLLILGSI